MKATWNNQTLAESDETIVIENNHYFPISSINQDFYKPSSKPAVAHGKARLPITP